MSISSQKWRPLKQLSATYMCFRTGIMIEIMCVRLNLEDDCMVIKFQITIILRIFFDLMKHCYQFLAHYDTIILVVS